MVLAVKFLTLSGFIAFLMLTSSLQAQDYQVVRNIENIIFTTYDPVHKKSLEIYKDGFKIVDPETGAGIFHPEPELSEAIKFKQVFFSRNKIFLATHFKSDRPFHFNDSLVYEISEIENKLNIHNRKFVFNDTLYQHGGYGFWSVRENLKAFYRGESNWRVVPSNSEKGSYPGVFQHLILKDKTKFYVIGGWSVLKTDPLKHILNNQLWSFDLKTRRWRKEGQLSNSLIRYYEEPTIEIELENKLLFQAEHMPTYILDVSSNKLTLHRTSTLLGQALQKQELDLKPFYHNNWFYLYRVKEAQTIDSIPKIKKQFTVELARVSPEAFIGPVIEEGPIFSSGIKSSVFFWSLAGSVLIILISIGYFLWARNNKAYIESSGIRYKGQFFELDRIHLSIIKLLINQNEPVSTKAILSITGNPEQDYSHNIRIKNQIIDDLNFLLKSIFNYKDNLIQVISPPDDKRKRQYRIIKKFFAFKGRFDSLSID